MKHSVSTYANATENVAIHSRKELNTTYLLVGDNDPLDYFDTILTVRGTSAERAEFLLRLIRAAEYQVARLEAVTA